MRKFAESPWLGTLLWGGAFLWIVSDFSRLAGLLSPWLTGKNTFIERVPLHQLAIQHVTVVLVSATVSILIGLGLGMAGHLPLGRSYRPLMLSLAAIGETFPTAAVLALAVPVLGFGWKPTLLALVLYGILPVLRNTLAGLDNIPDEIVEASDGMGMTETQRVFRVFLPLAAPVIIAGIRTTIIINVSAATIGAAVGAGGFGAPIVNGIRSFDPLLILQGAVPVALLAITLDSCFVNIESVFSRHLEIE